MADKEIGDLTAGTSRATAVMHAIEGGNSRKFTGLGRVGQVVNTQTGEVATGTTIIPIDNTIPQNTEGTEVMTLAITPMDAASVLIIDVVAYLSHSAANMYLTAALFQDSTANALAVAADFMPNATGPVTVKFRHKMTAGTISATTFKVRCGGNNTGTMTLNGASGGRHYGGVLASSITITEVLP